MEKLRETLRVRKERAILVAAVLGRDGDDLIELTALAESAGAVVVDVGTNRVEDEATAMRLWAMVSRSRMVTLWFWVVSVSTVMQYGVPISSCLR